MSDLKIDKHTEIIKNLIKNYKISAATSEIGIVVSNLDGILNISGLKHAELNEVLTVNESLYAVVLSLSADLVGAIMLSEYSSVKEGDTVRRTYSTFSAPTGDNLLGRAINVLGKAIDGKGEMSDLNWEQVEKIAPGVMERKGVTEPLYTGILAIDALIPIGKGQRELIIGDRQTGKTALALDAIINQKEKDCYCVYVSIGQKNSTLFQIIQKLEEKEALPYTTIINASASELPSLKFLAPFVGITIAEHWMKQGKDVLIVYDDLTQHAIAYRTLSLLLNFPPGREAFPGDIFYLHSRLLERAGRFNEKAGGGSITALPIIQTQADDISAYIPTNVISITDGQIFLKSLLFNQGQRPAIDVTLSVSRVGGSAQKAAIKGMGGNLKLELAKYFELLEFSRFGSDLHEQTKFSLDLGERIQKCLIQNVHEPKEPIEELFILFLIKERHLMEIKNINHISEFLNLALEKWKTSGYIHEIDFEKKIPIEMEDNMKSVAISSIEEFQKILEERGEN